MLSWALTFLVLALVAAALGFSGIASISMEMAQLIFLIFIVLFIITALAHVITGRKPPNPL